MNPSLSVILLVVASILVSYSGNSISDPQDPDGKVIAQLASVGSNLSKPHNIVFFFYFPAKGNAERIVTKLKTEGYSTSVQKSLSTHEYEIQARKSMLPVKSELVALRKEFNTLAATESGIYDGWGSEVAR